MQLAFKTSTLNDLLRGRMEREEHPICPKFVVVRANYEKGVRKVFLQSWVNEEVVVFFLFWSQP